MRTRGTAYQHKARAISLCTPLFSGELNSEIMSLNPENDPKPCSSEPGPIHRPHSSSFLGFICRILMQNLELLWGVRVVLF